MPFLHYWLHLWTAVNMVNICFPKVNIIPSLVKGSFLDPSSPFHRNVPKDRAQRLCTAWVDVFKSLTASLWHLSIMCTYGCRNVKVKMRALVKRVEKTLSGWKDEGRIFVLTIQCSQWTDHLKIGVIASPVKTCGCPSCQDDSKYSSIFFLHWRNLVHQISHQIQMPLEDTFHISINVCKLHRVSYYISVLTAAILFYFLELEVSRSG